jgi:transcriptional regulator with XRE-family HTH domain
MQIETVGERIRRLRLSKKISQKALANALGFNSPATVSSWENGEGQLSADIIVHLAEYFAVTTDYILLGKDEETKKSVKTEVIVERIQDIKVFSNLSWKGLPMSIFVALTAVVTEIVIYFGRGRTEAVLFAVFALWLVIFLVFSFGILLHPFKADQTLFIKANQVVLYQQAYDENKLAYRRGNNIVVGGFSFVMAIISSVFVFLTSGFIQPIIVTNLFQVFSVIAILLSGYQVYKVWHPAQNASRITHDVFDKTSSIDTWMMSLLLVGMIFISYSFYLVLYASTAAISMMKLTQVIMFVYFMTSLFMYAEKRRFTSFYELEIEN